MAKIYDNNGDQIQWESDDEIRFSLYAYCDVNDILSTDALCPNGVTASGVVSPPTSLSDPIFNWCDVVEIDSSIVVGCSIENRNAIALSLNFEPNLANTNSGFVLGSIDKIEIYVGLVGQVTEY